MKMLDRREELFLPSLLGALSCCVPTTHGASRPAPHTSQMTRSAAKCWSMFTLLRTPYSSGTSPRVQWGATRAHTS